MSIQAVASDLIRRSRQVTRPSRCGFQLIRREYEDGSIQYQIFADTERNGTQIAYVQSTRPDAEFIQACLAQAPLFEQLLSFADLADSLIEFVAMYDHARDLLGPDVRHKLERAEAALRKAGVR